MAQKENKNDAQSLRDLAKDLVKDLAKTTEESVENKSTKNSKENEVNHKTKKTLKENEKRELIKNKDLRELLRNKEIKEFVKEKDINWKLKLAPTMITIGALAFGLHALRFLLIEKYVYALICILSASLLDGFDGKVARYFKVSSKFGSILDTLVDFLNFGIVPGFLIYVKYFHFSQIKIGWIAVVFYITCTALRLARFSVIGMQDERFFKGVPAPGSSFLLVIPICIEQIFGSYNISTSTNSGMFDLFFSYFSITMAFLCGFLMLSSLKTISLSRIKIEKKYFSLFAGVFCASSACFYMYPWPSLLFLQLLYFVSIFKKR